MLIEDLLTLQKWLYFQISILFFRCFGPNSPNHHPSSLYFPLYLTSKYNFTTYPISFIFKVYSYYTLVPETGCFSLVQATIAFLWIFARALSLVSLLLFLLLLNCSLSSSYSKDSINTEIPSCHFQMLP